MTDDTEELEVDVELEDDDSGPRGVMFDVPDGQIMIPCLDTLAEVLGEHPAAYWATDKGLFFLSSQRRWESVEVTKSAAVTSLRKQ